MVKSIKQIRLLHTTKILAVLFILVMIFTTEMTNHYSSKGIVIDTYSNGEVLVEVSNGNIFSYYDSSLPPKGTRVIVKFNTNGTDFTVIDDYIESVTIL